MGFQDNKEKQPTLRALGGADQQAQEPPHTSSPPESEVIAKAQRRQFTSEYKLRILREAGSSRNSGDIGALLRREGLYSSLLTTWRRQREKGRLNAATGQQRGPRGSLKTPAEVELGLQRKENRRLAKRLARAELVIEIQKKVSELLGVSLPPLPKGDDD